MFLIFKQLIPLLSSNSNYFSMKNTSFGLDPDIPTKGKWCHNSIHKTNTEKYNCTLCTQYNHCSTYLWGNIIHGEDYLQLLKIISVLIFSKAKIFFVFCQIFLECISVMHVFLAAIYFSQISVISKIMHIFTLTHMLCRAWALKEVSSCKFEHNPEISAFIHQ